MEQGFQMNPSPKMSYMRCNNVGRGRTVTDSLTETSTYKVALSYQTKHQLQSQYFTCSSLISINVEGNNCDQ